jgi:hypothetical protein
MREVRDGDFLINSWTYFGESYGDSYAFGLKEIPNYEIVFMVTYHYIRDHLYTIM